MCCPENVDLFFRMFSKQIKFFHLDKIKGTLRRIGPDVMVSIPDPEAIPGGNLGGFEKMCRLILYLEGRGQKSHGKSHGQSNRKPEPVKIFITPS